MFDRFGSFDSYEQINRAAQGLKAEGDLESLKVLAEENGIDEFDLKDFVEGISEGICTSFTAAIGKIKIEKEDLKPSEIVTDWIDYIESELWDSEELQKAVRKSNKSLIGCIGAMLAWSYTHKYHVSSEIVKASGIRASGVEMGIPGMKSARKIIKEYYLEG